VHPGIDPALPDHVECVGAGRDERGTEDGRHEDRELERIPQAEVVARGGGQHHELRDTRLGQLEKAVHRE
jgi:hypothetical protein